jgi:hypothetical protein
VLLQALLTKGLPMSSSPTPPPTSADAAAVSSRPANHLIWAIVSTIAFFPLGFISLMYSIQVNSRWELGNVEGAEAASRKVLGFAGVAMFFGLIMVAITAIAFLVYSESLAGA